MGFYNVFNLPENLDSITVIYNFNVNKPIWLRRACLDMEYIDEENTDG